jgi:hypothetical protein
MKRGCKKISRKEPHTCLFKANYNNRNSWNSENLENGDGMSLCSRHSDIQFEGKIWTLILDKKLQKWSKSEHGCTAKH